jgi:hypothetical protein
VSQDPAQGGRQVTDLGRLERADGIRLSRIDLGEQPEHQILAAGRDLDQDQPAVRGHRHLPDTGRSVSARV